MKNLNSNDEHHGWENINYWMESIKFWTAAIEKYGDEDGLFGQHITVGWSMIDKDLFGV
jgi:hypothetical protein